MEGVSAFIVGTCQLHFKSFSDVFDSMQFLYPGPTCVAQHHFVCGSSAEFYIEPINSCIDDIDIMMSRADELAFTDDIPVLPDDIRGCLDTIKCFQIMPYTDYPGYVQLQYFGNIRYEWRCKRFELHQTYDFNNSVVARKLMVIIHNKNFREGDPIGPGFKWLLELNSYSDLVPCIWCPQWPKEAKHWPSRRRNHGWPTTANIRKIVQSGCHAVYARHPACGNDITQWRLSFSGAELILIQSWTPVQQIVYHMVRFFAKKELIKKDCPKVDEVLSTYHLKTLLLWSCEEMSPEWWNSLSVVEICCNLLRKLSEWLLKRHCPNYFIPQANLLHKKYLSQKVFDETIRRLSNFSHLNITNIWFTDNYIGPALARMFTFENTTETDDFGQCMLRYCAIVDDRKLKCFDWQFSNRFWHCTTREFREFIIEKGCAFRNYLNASFSTRRPVDRGSFPLAVEFISMFLQLGKVLFSLHAAIVLRSEQLTYDSDSITQFIKEVSWQPKVIRSKHHNFPKPNATSLDKSIVLFLKAQDLLENLTGLNSPKEFKLVSQMSKELLKKALYCDHSKTSAIRGVAAIYMAALHFSESDYETVVDFCSTVFINKASEEVKKTEEEEDAWETETLNAGCLLYIDDVVRIIGLYLLFRWVQGNLQYNRRVYLLDLCLTPEVFAYYLLISSNERRPGAFRLNYDLQEPTFFLDSLLMIITNRISSGISKKTKNVLRVYQRTDPINELEAQNKSFIPNENTIMQSLIEYSLENMSSFYHAFSKEFGLRCNVADCYRAAYLYKCRKYPEVLQLCERILEDPDLRSDSKELAVANVTVLPPLDSYFDNDIQCLLGIHTLVYYLSPLNEGLWKIQDNSNPTLQHFFAKEIHSDESAALSKVLLYSYTVKCHYFVGRHFLARYLTMRCLIDCNYLSSEVIFEFKKLKSHLPFEHIIHCFAQQKLRQLQNDNEVYY